MLELGLVLSNSAVAAGSATAADLLELAALADAAPDWDYVWVGDSLLSVPRLESVALVGALAARTRRVRLGVGCMASLGLREPILFALQWASVDVLSGGRVTLVACSGPASGPAIERELAAFGLTQAEKVARMEALVERLRAASVDGELRPGFVQRPLPIWIVANPSASAGPKTLDRVLGRVARLGDGWMTFGSDAALLRSRLARLQELRGAVAAFPVCVYVDVNLDADERRALDDAIVTCRQEGRRNATAEQLAATAAIGSAERCAEFVAALIEAGATHIALRPVTQRPREQAERLTEQLLPRLRQLA